MVLKMIHKDISLRANHYSCHQQRQPYPSVASASGSFTTPLPHFGSL
jgi:hypothetical protein